MGAGGVSGSGGQDRQLEMVKGIRKAFSNPNWEKVERREDGKIHDYAPQERNILQKAWSYLNGDGWK